ncbi:HNH endonuclease signature motif containing protein, partial [Pseudonocardia abyssalis]
ALALSVSRSTAGARIAQARRLTETLTATLAAHESGEIDGSRVRAICDATHTLSEDDAIRVQDRVLPNAARQSRAQLVAALRRAVIAVDPEGANDRHARARRDRRVMVGAEDEGMASLWALLAAPDALAAHQWLTRLARGLGSDDPRGMDARRADLLVGLLTGQVAVTDPAVTDPAVTDPAVTDPTVTDPGDESAEGARPGEAEESGNGRSVLRVAPVNPGKPLVHVVIPYSTLTGADDQPCELAGFGPVPADLAREIAADAVWKRLVTDPLSGALLDHGRTTYRPPAALTDFVRARDVHCRSPLCRRRALDSELDHTVPYPHGPTAEHNLTHGCTVHHHEKHSPGWSVVQYPDGTLEWTTPTGHTYVSEPFDYRPEPDPPPRRPGRRRRLLLDWTSIADPAADTPPF